MNFEINTDKIVDNVISGALERKIDGKTIKQWMAEIAKHQWISVKDRLPENAKHPGAFCQRYLVYTDYGITEGWYNPDKECWYGFLTFMTDEFEVWNIDLERGDIPKRVKDIPVKYWMPMPESPKEEQNG